jgi:hypothetical protein
MALEWYKLENLWPCLIKGAHVLCSEAAVFEMNVDLSVQMILCSLTYDITLGMDRWTVTATALCRFTAVQCSQHGAQVKRPNPSEVRLVAIEAAVC